MGLLEQQKHKVEAEIAKSFGLEGDAIEKGGKRTGYYANTSENKSKHRVGQSYAKVGKTVEIPLQEGTYSQGQFKNLFPKFPSEHKNIMQHIDAFGSTDAAKKQGAAQIWNTGKSRLNFKKEGNNIVIERIKNDKFASYQESKKNAPKGMKEPYGKGGASSTSGGSYTTTADAIKVGDTIRRPDGFSFKVTESYTTNDHDGTYVTLKGKGGKDVYKRLSHNPVKVIPEMDTKNMPNYDHKDIAQFSGTREKAVNDAIAGLKLDVGKLYDSVVHNKGGADFATAISGKMNNPMMKKLVKEFSTDVPMTLHSMQVVAKMDTAKEVSKNVMDNREKNMPKEAEKPKYDKEEALQVAKTIMDQLGGGKFKVMTGAKNLSFGGDGSLSFKLPGGGGFTKQGINHVKITLNSMDTYDMTFGKVRAGNFKVIDEQHNIYNDQLRSIFTHVTGLHTSLGKGDEDELEKGGEGSKGGKVIGHTKSGKPIYDTHGHASHGNFTDKDHMDAYEAHKKDRMKNPDLQGKQKKHSYFTEGAAHLHSHDKLKKKPKSLGENLAKLGLKHKEKQEKMYGKNKNLKLTDGNPNLERQPPRG